MLQPVAWLIIGDRHHKESTIDYSHALQSARDHHGLIHDLVMREIAEEAIRGAYDQGRRDALFSHREHE